MRSDEGSARFAKMVERAGEEVRRFVVMFLYLWVMLGLFVLLEAVAARRSGYQFTWSFGFAFFNALILAKVMLVAEQLRIGVRIRAKPLIFPILIEALLTATLFVAFHVVEKVFLGVVRGEAAAAAVPHGGIVELLCVGLIFFVALVPF